MPHFILATTASTNIVPKMETLPLEYSILIMASLISHLNGGVGSFVQRQSSTIKEHIRIGSEGVLRDCDLLNMSPRHFEISDEIPHWNIEVDFAASLDLKALTTTCSCILLLFRVDEIETLTPPDRIWLGSHTAHEIGYDIELGT